MAEEQARAYLLEAFRCDPATEPGTLLTLRRARRGGASLRPGASKPAVTPRREVEAALTELSEQFFELDGEQQRARLEKIDAEAYPDLARRVRRLGRVARCAQDIAAAHADPKVDHLFYNAYLRMLVAPQREAAELQRKALASLRTSDRRRRATRTVKVLKARFPSVYELDTAWFGRVGEAKRILADRRAPVGYGLGIFGVWILLRLLFRLIKWASGGDG